MLLRSLKARLSVGVLLLLGLAHLSLTSSIASTEVPKNACIVEDRDSFLIDTGSTLKQIEQAEATQGSCDQYARYIERKTGTLKKEFEDHPEALRAKVLCGKWMFFNLGMRSSVGVPVKLLRAMETYRDAGPRLKKLGFLDDESWSKEPYPFGVVPVKYKSPISFRHAAAGKAVQISCAGCHTGKLPDGRVSVGAANHELDFGKFNALALYSIWVADRRKEDPKRWAPELIAYYQGLDRERNRPGIIKMVGMMSKVPLNSVVLRHLIGEEPPAMASQKSLLRSKPGVFNGFAPILNFSDRELYISLPQIWEIGNYTPVHYGSLAGMESLDDFILEAIAITTQMPKYDSKKYVEPIREYMKCLQTPRNPVPSIPSLKARGQELFSAKCQSCHDLPDGASSQAYDFEKIGTPLVFRNLFDGYRPTDIQSKRTYRVFKKMGIADFMTQKIRARRLNGIWTRKNLGSNGAIEDLDHLFCLEGKNRKRKDIHDPLGDAIHTELCDDYSIEERLALREHLNTF